MGLISNAWKGGGEFALLSRASHVLAHKTIITELSAAFCPVKAAQHVTLTCCQNNPCTAVVMDFKLAQCTPNMSKMLNLQHAKFKNPVSLAFVLSCKGMHWVELVNSAQG